MRTIEIDFDVHKLIEAERRSFSDAPNAALRRLLKLPDSSQPSAFEPVSKPPSPGWAGEGWRGKNVFLPNGTQLRMSYNGRVYNATIEGSCWKSEGGVFTSPSGAASGLAKTKTGKATRLDGWGYWEALLPGESEWVRLNELWRRANPDRTMRIEDLEIEI